MFLPQSCFFNIKRPPNICSPREVSVWLRQGPAWLDQDAGSCTLCGQEESYLKGPTRRRFYLSLPGRISIWRSPTYLSLPGGVPAYPHLGGSCLKESPPEEAFTYFLEGFLLEESPPGGISAWSQGDQNPVCLLVPQRCLPGLPGMAEPGPLIPPVGQGPANSQPCFTWNGGKVGKVRKQGSGWGAAPLTGEQQLRLGCQGALSTPGVRVSGHVGVRCLRPDKIFLLTGHLSLPEQQVPAEGEEQHLLLLRPVQLPEVSLAGSGVGRMPQRWPGPPLLLDVTIGSSSSCPSFLLPSLLFPVLDTASTSFPLALIYVGKGCQLHFTDEKLRLSDVVGGEGKHSNSPTITPYR